LNEAAPSSNTSHNFLVYFLLTLILVCASLNLIHLWIQTSNPAETSTPESLFILHAQNITQGKPLYSDFRIPPYNLAPYTPGYYLILAGLKTLFSLDIEQLFVIGRRFVIGLMLILAVLIYWHSLKITNDKILSLMTFGLFVGCYLLWPAACTNRADLPGVLFSVMGVLVIKHAEKRGLYLCIPFFVLAFYTKQTFVSASIATFVYLLLNKNYRNAFIFSGLTALSIIGIWFLLHQLTAGMSTLNLVGSNVAPLSFLNVRLISILAIQTATLQFILSFAGLKKYFWNNLPSIYFLVSLLWAIFTAAKSGSDANYFLEPLAAGCLLIPEALQRNLQRMVPSRTLLAAAFVLLIAPQINFMFHTLQAIHFRNDESARKLAGAAEGIVISDNPRLSLVAKRPFFVEPFPYSYLEKTGNWNSAELLSLMKDGSVELFIMTNPFEQPLTWQRVTRLPQSVIETAKAEYNLAGRVDGYYVYKHK
jgi:hypothetical protein